MKDRIITDNAILSMEAFHSMSIGQPFLSKDIIAVKLDMMKPYNLIEWECLNWMLQNMQFPLQLKCVSSVSFRVLINGKPSKSFVPSRGIRQGDPLSPYLFVIYYEGFFALIKQQIGRQLWMGLPFGHQSVTLPFFFFFG